MNFEKINKILAEESAFRLKQAQHAIFIDLIDDWQEATVLPLALRQKLNQECPLAIDGEVFIAKDGRTAKVLLTLSDGLKVETVLMRHDGRNTVCVSSQVGCALGCKFCATGKLGFKRNLSSDEIINQVLFFARYLKNPSPRPSPFVEGGGRREGVDEQRVNNIVFMGMGEPLLNYKNIIKTIRILNDKNAFNLGVRHFSISTVGIPEGIKKLAEENLAVNLAVS